MDAPRATMAPPATAAACNHTRRESSSCWFMFLVLSTSFFLVENSQECGTPHQRSLPVRQYRRLGLRLHDLAMALSTCGPGSSLAALGPLALHFGHSSSARCHGTLRIL